ncbi:MAG TPA: hypothetical protein VMS93_03900 [Candidatus Saccharimonadales bacterium]|nr:hypothetical protein [Candidatus Saccharimonadales bacterium]
MAKTVNAGRVFLGGLVAGLVLNVVSILDNTVLLTRRLQWVIEEHHMLATPRLPFIPIWVVLMFLLGIAMVWLYALARERLGPGPGTAFKVGLVAGLIAGVPANFSMASWGMMGRLLPCMWMLEMVVGGVLGTLLGAWTYKEEPAA